MCLCPLMLAFKWKERAFIGKVSSRCVCWFPVATFICVPKLYTNVASPYKALQWCMTRFSKKLRNCGPHRPETWTNCLYISLLKYFIFLASSTGWFPSYFFVLCLLRDSENDLYKTIWNTSGVFRNIKSLDAPVKSTKIPTPWCPCLLYSDRFII